MSESFEDMIYRPTTGADYNDLKVFANKLIADRDRWKATAEKLGEALRRMLSSDTDWENGEIGVGNTFRIIAREALAAHEAEMKK